jgi:hypothetical protein
MTGYAEEIAAAMAVLDRHLIALNAGDAPGIADTLHFPHYRLAGTRMQVWQTSDTYLADFLKRAGEGWDHTKWDYRNVIAASRDKVHIDLQFTRYREDDSELGSFRSIWVISLIEGRWAAQLRSSFAG